MTWGLSEFRRCEFSGNAALLLPATFPNLLVTSSETIHKHSQHSHSRVHHSNLSNFWYHWYPAVQSEYLLWNCCLINILYIMFQVKKTKCGFWHNLHIRGTVLTPLHSVANHGLISLISFSVFWHLHFLFNLVAPQKKIPIFRRYKV